MNKASSTEKHTSSGLETGLMTSTLVHPAEHVELLYTQARSALSMAFLAALVIAAVLWGQANQTLLLVWLGAQAVQTLGRVIIVTRYHRADSSVRNDCCWVNRYICGAFVGGIVWGSLGLLVEPAWPAEFQVIAVMGIAGILAGAISSYAIVMPVYVSFMLPAMLIPAQAFLLRPGYVQQEMGILCIVFACAMLLIARNYSHSVDRTLQLRHENDALMEGLEVSNDALKSEIRFREQVEADLRRDRQLFTEGIVTVFRWRAEAGWPIEYVSKTVSQYGFDAGQLMRNRTPFSSLLHASDLARVEESGLDGSDHGFIFSGIDYRIVRPDGQVHWVCDYTIPITNNKGEVTHYTGYLLDITDRKHTESALQHERDRAEVTLKSIVDAVITIDINGQIEYMNPAAEEFTGWSDDVARGLQFTRVFSLFDEDSVALLTNEMQWAVSEKQVVQSTRDIAIGRNDGSRSFIQYSMSPILGHEDSPLGAVIVFSDVTEQRYMQSKLSRQETHDVLTGLMNRSEFSIRLQALLEQDDFENEDHILCLLNLDGLKVINDTCSYAAGDHVIKTVASLLPGRLRDTDILARLDGDQFGILLRHCLLKDATEIIDNILILIHDATYEEMGVTTSIQTTASIGLVKARRGDNVVNILAAADLACGAAKEQGGNRLHIYQDSEKELDQRHDEMRWVPRIREAIKSDRLVLYFQDIVPVRGNDQSGLHFELLIRMLDENNELVAPDRFLPAAERYKIISIIDRWVIDHSFEWYQRKGQYIGNGEAMTMAINLSGASVTDSALLAYIKEQLTYYAVPATAVCFEITETAAVANLQAAADFIKDLQHIGCKFALDDFGSGMSSFSYLKNLPVDYLKIDGSLVRGIESDNVNYAMVNSIHQLGSVMGIETIAEFVENDAMREKLVEIGVDYAQGYGICRPRPLEDKGKVDEEEGQKTA